MKTKRGKYLKFIINIKYEIYPLERMIELMIKRKIIITSNEGLHIRPASKLAKLANTFKCDVKFKSKEKMINAKSILELISVGAKCNDTLEVECNGEDEENAIRELAKAFKNKFEFLKN